MLLRKERLSEIDRIRQKNQKWKNDVAKQLLEKELEKKNQKMRELQKDKAEEEKIRRYQDLINSRVREGGASKRGMEGGMGLGDGKSKSLVRGVMGENRREKDRGKDKGEGQEIKQEMQNGRLYQSAKRKEETPEEEDIPLFPQLSNQIERGHVGSVRQLPIKREKEKEKEKDKKIETQKQKQIFLLQPEPQAHHFSPVQQSLPPSISFPVTQPSAPNSLPKNRKKSLNTHRRQDTVQSINLPQKPISIQFVSKLQQQNKKLKQQLRKKNETVQNLLKLIKAQHAAQQIEQEIEIGDSREIGFTEYVRMVEGEREKEKQKRKVSPPRVLFPSLDFKDAGIIFKFNLKAAKRANEGETAEFLEQGEGGQGEGNGETDA